MPDNDWLFLKCKAVPIIDHAYFLTNITKVFYTPIGYNPPMDTSENRDNEQNLGQLWEKRYR